MSKTIRMKENGHEVDTVCPLVTGCVAFNHLLEREMSGYAPVCDMIHIRNKDQIA